VSIVLSSWNLRTEFSTIAENRDFEAEIDEYLIAFSMGMLPRRFSQKKIQQH
jgi:hypothetical protein